MENHFLTDLYLTSSSRPTLPDFNLPTIDERTREYEQLIEEQAAQIRSLQKKVNQLQQRHEAIPLGVVELSQR